MSTRSGKRIHMSLLEDTAATEQERAVKTERKTRSKRVKENLDELSVSIFKNKKRNNYVSYPTDDELIGDTANKKQGEPSRALRKNALKEHNPIETSDQLEPQDEVKNLVRKTRRFKKFDDAEEAENHENEPAVVTEKPKSKKRKKKVEPIINTPHTEEAPAVDVGPAKKSKKKKKKGKKSSSIIVEDIPQNDNSQNSILNRSNMSVDSFHSAAGSPYRNANTDTERDGKVNTTVEKCAEITKSKKSNKKNCNNNTFDNNDKSINMSTDKVEENKNNNKGNKKRKPVTEDTLDQCFVAVARDNLERSLEDIDLSNRQLRRRKSTQMSTLKSITRNVSFDKNIISANFEKDVDNNLNDSEKFKSIKQVSQPENMLETFDKGLRSSSVVKDITFDKINASITKDINADIDDTDVSTKQHKTRRSIVKDSTFDKSNTSMAKEIFENTVDTDLNISNQHHKTIKTMLKDSTFYKSNVSIAKEDLAVEIDLNVSKKHLKARKSILKDSTFDKSNASLSNGNIEKDTEPENINESNISNNLRRRKSNIKDSTFDKQEAVLNTTFEKETEKSKETIKDSTFNISCNIANQEPTSTTKTKKTSVNTTYDQIDKAGDATFEKDISTSFDAFKNGANTRKSSIRDTSFDKTNFSVASLSKEDFEKDNNIITSSATKRKSLRLTFDINDTISETAVNTTYEKKVNSDDQKLRLSKTTDIQTVLNTTFEKENTNEDAENLISSSNSKTSLISSDNSSVTDKSDISRISITSDESSEHVENIVNTTPLLIESSIDESHISITKPDSPKPQTPLKREGTFTKDTSEQIETQVETPTKRKSVPTAGCTPYHISKSSQKKTLLNVTRSLEKGIRASVDSAPRLTRVMFCSPVDNPVSLTQEKRKIIKSNLKGSNKSFVFDESASMSRPARKRSYTQNDADDARIKRSRLTEDLQHSVDRLSRPRTASATAKLSVVTPKKPSTPSKPKSDSKQPRTKLPNFAALHQKQFDRMESLNECQERKAKRAKQLLTPTAPPGLLERISPNNNTDSPKKSKESAKPIGKTDTSTKKLPSIESSRPGQKKTDTPTKKVPATESSRPGLKKTDTPTKKVPVIEYSQPGQKEKTDTPTKKLPAVESSRPGFTRFGFKLNLDFNPFSIPSKTVEKPKEKPVVKPNGIVPRMGVLPSLAGGTSLRREVAKLAVMREKSFTDRRNVTRNENRTVIKGVRTNRRFELQMKMRNID